MSTTNSTRLKQTRGNSNAASMTTMRFASSSPTVFLRPGFVPSQWDVLCGRGAECFNHNGNKRLRQLVEDNYELYINSCSKSQKGVMITEIIKRIKCQCIEGGFVKKDLLSGRYIEVSESVAREKVSQTFREVKAIRQKTHRAMSTNRIYLTKTTNDFLEGILHSRSRVEKSSTIIDEVTTNFSREKFVSERCQCEFNAQLSTILPDEAQDLVESQSTDYACFEFYTDCMKETISMPMLTVSQNQTNLLVDCYASSSLIDGNEIRSILQEWRT